MAKKQNRKGKYSHGSRRGLQDRRQHWKKG